MLTLLPLTSWKTFVDLGEITVLSDAQVKYRNLGNC